MFPWLIIPAAVLLDLILGDPHRLPHPVRLMGRAIEKFEPLFRRFKLPLVLSGGLFWLFLAGMTFFLTAAITALSGAINPHVRIIAEIILIYYCLSARCLSKEAMGVYNALKADDLTAARNRVATIVGRETQNLSSSGVAQAAVETVAENLVDGFVAPLFFAAIGGAPLAMVYKMVNTLDSMVGYKNEKYLLFGRVPACMDDLFNYLPARMAVAIIALCAEILSRGSGRRAIATAAADGRKHASPNSGFSEAAFAGALQVRLGGPNTYHGMLVKKPYIGETFSPVSPRHIPIACRLMLLSALIFSLCMWLISIWRA